MDCLDDNTVSAYLGRRLESAEADAVIEHLSGCDACLALTCAAGSEEETAPPTIGRYEIVDVLGQGAMGTVYVARDPQLAREVALKVVRADRHARGDIQARLAREARAMAQVRHENVVAVYDAGELADGVFIAMELVDGQTLTRWLAAAPRSSREVIEAFVVAGRGLAAAHAAGIVHRDFKPDNVLVGAAGRVQVTDFGVAAVRDDDTLEATTVADGDVGVTRSGALLGTPRYMAPEQLRGERADARSDQFGFAVALYEALYGAPPFAGASVGEIARSISTGAVPAPPASRVPAGVHRALVRALAQEPASRFASMSALVDALLVGLRASGRRVRRVLALAAVGTAAVLALAVWRLWPAFPPTPVSAPMPAGRTQVLIAPLTNQTGVEMFDDSLDIVAAAVIAASTKLDAMAGVELWATTGGGAPDIAAIAAQRAPSAQGAIALVRGRVHRDGPGYTVELEARLRGRAGVVFGDERHAATADGLLPATAELAADLVRALGDPSPPTSGALSTSVAAVHAYAQGQRQALGDANAAIASFGRALALDPELSAARAALGLTLYNVQHKAEAIVELERAFRAADRIPERQRLTLLGDYYGVVGRYSEAILAYQQLLAKWPGDGRAQLNLTSTAIDANSWPLALEVARSAAERYGRLEVVRRNLVIAELGNNRFAEVVRDGGALLAEVPSPSDPAIAALVSAYALVGRRADAAAMRARVGADLAPHATADLAAYEGRLADAEAALRDRPGEVDQMVLAHVHLRRGDRPAAIAAARGALREDTMPLAYMAASVAAAAGDSSGLEERARAWIDAPESDRRMFGQLLLGDLALAAKQPEAARAAYRAASRIGDSWLVHDRLARAAFAAGNHVEAERELRWCIDHRGTAAVVANPSLFLVPEVHLLLARSIAARGGDARDAYRALVDLAPAAQDDPWTEEARRALQ